MHFFKYFVIIGLLCVSIHSKAQEVTNMQEVVKKTVPAHNQKGAFFGYWGWNRSFYTNSNITLKGADYDITLQSVKATDRPTPISAYNYLRIDRITIPQTNFRIGYFIKDNFSVSVGVDHMKYVMTNNQTVNAEGSIHHAGDFFADYNGPIKLTEDFLTFEHTDGLNYINVEVEKYHHVYNNKAKNFDITCYYGGGAGVLVPKSNVKFLDYERSDRFHLSGYGFSLKAGFQFTILRHLSLRFEQKFGYINMPNIALHQQGIQGVGKQQFFFAETAGMIGAVYQF